MWDNRDQDREQLTRALSASGHEVVATASAAEFRGLLSQQGWDIVVSDLLDSEEEDLPEREGIKLLETTGYRLAQEVRERHPSVLIFLVTRFRRVSEVGLERLKAPVFLDSKLGQSFWLVYRMEQVHRLLREKELLAENERELKAKLDESLAARQDAKHGRYQMGIAAGGFLLFLITLVSGLALPEQWSGTNTARILLVFGLAARGESRCLWRENLEKFS